jgi:hypothetical protein
MLRQFDCSVNETVTDVFPPCNAVLGIALGLQLPGVFLCAWVEITRYYFAWHSA